MKTTLCFTLTLLIFALLTFVPNSFAQANEPHNMVRLIYFVPNGLTPQRDMNTKIDTLIKKVQTFYADEMERHGFGRKTFVFEADSVGNAVVHRVNGKVPYGADYHTLTFDKELREEVYQPFDSSKNVCFIVVEAGQEMLQRFCGSGNHNIENKNGAGDRGGEALVAASGRCFVGNSGFIIAAHELGHAFGLEHDFSNDTYLMSYGAFPYELALCSAEWFNASRYFNNFHQTPPNRGITTIKMLPPTVSATDGFRFQFKVSDPDGLQIAHLIMPEVPGLPGGLRGGQVGCKKLTGKSQTVEFVTTELPVQFHSRFYYPYVTLRILDSEDNLAAREEIDISDLYPSPQVVSIPDANLASAIRGALKLKTKTITQLDMLELRVLSANTQKITDLTGLEHAKNLKYLYLQFNQISDITVLGQLPNLATVYLQFNQISDITPLAKLTNLLSLGLSDNPIDDISRVTELTQLRGLYLRGYQIQDLTPFTGFTNLRRLNLEINQIIDITPLAALTELELLYLSRNQISDITPLAKLTRLENLRLIGNQIADVSPLAELQNLRRLYLFNNPIKNRKPLLELLRKNPDIKIYLKNDREPLPVTLSHFRAEHTDAGVVLKWTTESEVDNAGFYIHRSETKDGEFRVVNPTMIQGAGTTGERNEYTWTDTTAKPNVAYYYRIEDISHAGVRKQLATVHMRGLVSANWQTYHHVG